MGVRGTSITRWEWKDLTEEQWTSAVDAQGGSMFLAETVGLVEHHEGVLLQHGVSDGLFALGRFPADHPVDSATQILSLRAIVAAEIAKKDGGSVDRAARYAYLLGVIAAREDMKRQWERSALTGNRVREGGRAGAARVNPPPESLAKRDQEILRKFDRHREKGMSVGRAHEALAVEYGCTARTIFAARRRAARA
jgi:hypothetical protein